MRLTNIQKQNKLSSTKRSKDKIKLIIAHQEEGEGGPKKILQVEASVTSQNSVKIKDLYL